MPSTPRNGYSDYIARESDREERLREIEGLLEQLIFEGNKNTGIYKALQQEYNRLIKENNEELKAYNANLK